MRTFLVITIVALTISACGRKSQSSCLANLREIDGAKAMLASDQKLTNDAAVTKEQLLPYVMNGPSAPQGGQYSLGKMGESPKCSDSAHSHYEEPRD